MSHQPSKNMELGTQNSKQLVSRLKLFNHDVPKLNPVAVAEEANVA